MHIGKWWLHILYQWGSCEFTEMARIHISCWAFWKSMKICKLVNPWAETLSWINSDHWLTSNGTDDFSGKHEEEDTLLTAFILDKDKFFMTFHPLMGLHFEKCTYLCPGLDPFYANIVTGAAFRLCTFVLLKWVYQPGLIRKKMQVKCLFWILDFSHWLLKAKFLTSHL